MNINYNIADVGITTSQGEGWGLTTMEGMACEVPQIVGDYAALGEWPGSSVVKIPASEMAVTGAGINIVGQVMDRTKTIEALNVLYHNRDARRAFGRDGRKCVEASHFRWEEVGKKFNEVIEAAIDTLGVRHRP